MKNLLKPWTGTPQSGLLVSVVYYLIVGIMLSATYNTLTTDYAYKLGGSGGTLQATIRITYTDECKNKFLSAERI